MSKTKKMKAGFTQFAKATQKFEALMKAAEDWKALAEKSKADVLAAAQKNLASAKTELEKDFWGEFVAVVHGAELSLTSSGAKIADSHAKSVEKRFKQLEKDIAAEKKEAAKKVEAEKKAKLAEAAAAKKAAAEKKKADAKAAKEAAAAPKPEVTEPAAEEPKVEAGAAKQIDLNEAINSAQEQVATPASTTFPVA